MTSGYDVRSPMQGMGDGNLAMTYLDPDYWDDSLKDSYPIVVVSIVRMDFGIGWNTTRRGFGMVAEQGRMRIAKDLQLLARTFVSLSAGGPSHVRE